MNQKLTQLTEFIKNRWKLLLFLLIALGVGLFFYFRAQAKEAEAKRVEFVPVTQGELIKTIGLSGVVDAKNKARLSFAAGGKLVYLGVEEGDSVEKWQTLATIDRSTLQEQLEIDLNNYLDTRWDYEQIIDDLAENDSDQRVVVSDLKDRRTIDQSQFDLNNAVNTVEIRNIAIRDTVLSAPFAGVVTATPTSTSGVQLGITDYFELVDPQSMIFRAFVEEEDVDLLSIGQSGSIDLDAFDQVTTKSYIDYISFTSVQTSTGTAYVVEFPLFEKTALPLRLGMNGDVDIEVARASNALYVPLNATRDRGDTTYVDVKSGEQEFEERAIEVGLITDDYVEVLSGLDPTDMVVLP